MFAKLNSKLQFTYMYDISFSFGNVLRIPATYSIATDFICGDITIEVVLPRFKFTMHA